MPASRRQGGLPGRPRKFDEDAALTVALDLFWRQGYKATSLDDLTRAIGVSRSSFYSAFGSKHKVLLAALNRFCDGRVAEFTDYAAVADARKAILSILYAMADFENKRNGCFLFNCLVELAPHDPEVCALSARQIRRVEELMASLMVRAGVRETEAPEKTRALLSLAWGAGVLSKAGVRIKFEDHLPR